MRGSKNRRKKGSSKGSGICCCCPELDNFFSTLMCATDSRTLRTIAARALDSRIISSMSFCTSLDRASSAKAGAAMNAKSTSASTNAAARARPV